MRVELARLRSERGQGPSAGSATSARRPASGGRARRRDEQEDADRSREECAAGEREIERSGGRWGETRRRARADQARPSAERPSPRRSVVAARIPEAFGVSDGGLEAIARASRADHVLREAADGHHPRPDEDAHDQPVRAVTGHREERGGCGPRVEERPLGLEHRGVRIHRPGAGDELPPDEPEEPSHDGEPGKARRCPRGENGDRGEDDRLDEEHRPPGAGEVATARPGEGGEDRGGHAHDERTLEHRHGRTVGAPPEGEKRAWRRGPRKTLSRQTRRPAGSDGRNLRTA